MRDIAIVKKVDRQENIANIYALKCFSLTMVIYSLIFILNTVNIFIVEQKLMVKSYVPSMFIYIIVLTISKIIKTNNHLLKYIILTGIIMMCIITSVFLTYHTLFISVLPITYSTIYSSKKVMRYVCILMIIGTFIIVYGGYYNGVCDANMTLLTNKNIDAYVVNGKWTSVAINDNVTRNLFLFFVLPRVMMCIVLILICNSISHILTSSLEKAELTDELARAKLIAERANNAKSKFIARISHEVRTPINSIMGMNELILRETNEEDIRGYSYDIKNSSILLLDIVNEILDSSKIEKGLMNIVPVNYSVANMLNNIYSMFRVKVSDKGLKLIFNVDENIPSCLYGDEVRIRQIINNLLSNAVKYTNKGEIVFSIRVAIKDNKAIVSYSVKDTGIGIREEDKKSIGNEFKRFDEKRNHIEDGFGLGLSIVKDILSQMDSELFIESEYERGSEFKFSIEQEIIDSEPIGDFFKKKDNNTPEKQFKSLYIAPSARILAVDDYKANLKVFCGLLKGTQIHIDTALSGEECIEILEKANYDMVFIDHMLPGMDGIETLELIKKRNLARNTPIIMFTANVIIGEREKYMQKGFDEFLSKPIIIEKLDRIILKFLPKDKIEYPIKLENKSESVETDVMKNTIDVERQDDGCSNLDENSNDMSKLSKFKEAFYDINTKKALDACLGDVDFYFEIVHDVINSNIVSELEDYIKNNDYKKYYIRIHGFKNTVYTIGANELGDIAYELEQLLKEEKFAEVPRLHYEFIARYNSICKRYKSIL